MEDGSMNYREVWKLRDWSPGGPILSVSAHGLTDKTFLITVSRYLLQHLPIKVI